MDRRPNTATTRRPDTKDVLLGEAHGNAKTAHHALWSLQQRIDTPKLKNTDEERRVIARAKEAADNASQACADLLARL